MQTKIIPEKLFDVSNFQDLIAKSEVFAFPTETVYGLGVSWQDEKAIEKLYALKKRVRDKPMTIHISNLDQIDQIAIDIPDEFYLLAEAFFPGPLTIILKKHSGVSDLISSDNTIGIRMPSHDFCLKIIDCAGGAIVGTSANMSGEKNLTTAQEVYQHFYGQIGVIYDGKTARLQRASTVLSLEKNIPTILRKGVVSASQIEKVIKKPVV